MAMPLVLPHGNLITPALIRGVVKFKGKGVALRNEFNKIQDFIPETDARRQQIIVDCLLQFLPGKHAEWYCRRIFAKGRSCK